MAAVSDRWRRVAGAEIVERDAQVELLEVEVTEDPCERASAVERGG